MDNPFCQNEEANPFFEPSPPAMEAPKLENNESKIDVTSLIGQRKKEKILASPDLILSKKAINMNRRSSVMAHKMLGRFSTQDPVRADPDSGTTMPISEGRQLQAKSIEESKKAETKEEETKKEIKEQNKEINLQSIKKNIKNNEDNEAINYKERNELKKEMYTSPRGNKACCDLKMDGCAIV